jgi:hypothetical protein
MRGHHHGVVSVVMALAVAMAMVMPSTAAALRSSSDRGGDEMPASLSPTASVTTRLDDRRYAAAGDQAYDVGTEAGRYPAMGWHIRGEMGGIWAPPLKLLDGIWFGLDGSWLGPATRFSSGYGYVRFDVPGPDGLRVTRTDFAPDGHRAVLIGLTIRNDGGERVAPLTMDAHSELLSAYPWGWTTPNQSAFNLPDTAQVQDGRLVFREVGTPPVANAASHDWAAVVGSTLRPVASATGTDFRGPQSPPVVCPSQGSPTDPRCDDGPFGRGAGGELRYQLPLPAHASRTVWFTVAGSDQSLDDAQRQFTSASADPFGLLERKVGGRLELAGQTRLDLPGDPGLATAIDWGKQNLADLTQEAHNIQVRLTNQGNAYPAPIGTLSSIRFEGAGFPDYPWMFATDGEYTSYALVAAGQIATVKDHLRSLRSVSEIANQGSGKVVHETVTDGSIYFGLNADPGDMDETAKFPDAVALVWRWTGDNAWRDEMYPFAKKNLEYLLTKADADLWPAGSGNVENPNLGQDKLDVAVYTLRGLYDLADMAATLHDQTTRQWALSRAQDMRTRFEGAWWMPEIPQYADSLTDPGAVKGQQRWWIGDTPMEAELYDGSQPVPGLAAHQNAQAALDLRHTSCYTGPSGLYVEGVAGCDGGGPSAQSNRSSFSLNTAIQAVAEGNYGRMAASQQQRYTSFNRDLQLKPDEMPGALPEIGPSPDFVDNIDQPFTTRSMFMQAWGLYGTIWPVVHQQLGVSPDLGDGRLEITPQVPDGQERVSGSHIVVGDGLVDVTASHDDATYRTWLRSTVRTATFIGYTLPAGAKIKAVTLDGRPVASVVRDSNRGRQVLVATSSGVHQLVVTTA